MNHLDFDESGDDYSDNEFTFDQDDYKQKNVETGSRTEANEPSEAVKTRTKSRKLV
jgi:hypothetical protein